MSDVLTVAELIKRLELMPYNATIRIWACERGEWAAETEDNPTFDQTDGTVTIHGKDCLA